MNRCVNDLFGYCTDQPDGKPVTTERVAGYYKGVPEVKTITLTDCALNPQTCRKYRSHTQELRRFIKTKSLVIPASLEKNLISL